jgi:hypothetical protein
MRGISWLPILGKLAVGIGLLGVLIVCARDEARRAPPHFATAAQAKQFFVRQGLYWGSSAKEASGCYGNFFVANRPISYAEIQSAANQRNRGLTSAWSGILWVCQINCHATLATSSVAGKSRVWGNVLVAGDEALMDRIEDLYRND